MTSGYLFRGNVTYRHVRKENRVKLLSKNLMLFLVFNLVLLHHLCLGEKAVKSYLQQKELQQLSKSALCLCATVKANVMVI